jgi:hypothetical protein
MNGKPERGVCRVCRCTERTACNNGIRSCHWVNGTGQTLCSSCESLSLPETAAEWQCLVDSAAGALSLHAARFYGLAHGGPYVDCGRALRFLSIGRERGYQPSSDAVEKYVADLLEQPKR